MEFKKCFDGFIKITIPEIEVVTYAKDLEDAKVAIAEALESYRILSSQFASVSEKKNNKLVVS
jgi:hypothetical protein